MDKGMPDEKKVYVIGHKNPDTDSICSAIAYADYKNKTTHGIRYVAKRAGQINEETEFVLKYFGIEPPGYLPDTGTQVSDMEIHKTPFASSELTIREAWKLMNDCGAVTLPITDTEDHLEGLIAISDIAKFYMNSNDKTLLSSARTSYKAMAETLNGSVVIGNEHGYFIHGKVLIGAGDPKQILSYMEEDDLVILGNREDTQTAAINANASCIIICGNYPVSQDVQSLAAAHSCVVISTPMDSYSIACLINQSIPVKFLMKRNDLVTFRTKDFTDNIRETMGRMRFRDFPVINSEGRCIGTVSRRNLISLRKKKVILVDHNEKTQAPDNIDEAEILEIIDHHRIGSLETLSPVFFRNQPVGCTGTIIYQVYQEKNLPIPKDIAGLLCAAILSDTLMFRSPTCTKYDQEAVNVLSKIAGLEIEAFANQMFEAGSNLSAKSPEEIFYQDFKKFIAGTVTFGVGQINSMSSRSLHEIEDRIRPFMANECGKNGITMVFFMLTNIIDESTKLLCYGTGSEKLAEASFGTSVSNGSCLLPGVVSRKKQLIPAMMSTLQKQ